MLPIVPIQPKRVSEYAEAAGEEALDRLYDAAHQLQGLRVLNISSTAYGGGVSELLQTQVPLMNDLGVETTWVVIEGSDRFFNVTKAVHNALQGAETHLDDEMRETYWERMHANAAELPDDYDVVVVHDPQPAAMLQVLEDASRRKGKWIWRCHIDLSAPYRPVWDFFEPIVNLYDAAIFTAEEYVQPGVQGPVRAFIPPSIDPLSPKRQPERVGAGHRGQPGRADRRVGVDVAQPGAEKPPVRHDAADVASRTGAVTPKALGRKAPETRAVDNYP